MGKNRKVAGRAKDKLQVQEDEGTFQPQRNMRFEDFGVQWREGLERPKDSTKDSYRSSVEWATKAFGGKLVRHLTPDDVTHMVTLMRKARLSRSTRAKHLRVVSGCLDAAVRRDYAARNPIAQLAGNEKPEAETREAPFFVEAELPRLFAEIPEGVYRVFCEVALKTGMREGELAALTWGDIEMSEAVIHVCRAYRSGRVSTPKNRKKREVHLTADVVDLLGRWWGELGSPGDDVLVFPGSGKTGYIENHTLLKQMLYPAMKRAGIPRECPEGRARGEKRTFHSFRHTFAKQALARKASLSWLQEHLGHSSINVTRDIYGHFERAEHKKQIKELEGAFGV